jgi:hypothetical protein
MNNEYIETINQSLTIHYSSIKKNSIKFVQFIYYDPRYTFSLLEKFFSHPWFFLHTSKNSKNTSLATYVANAIGVEKYNSLLK